MVNDLVESLVPVEENIMHSQTYPKQALNDADERQRGDPFNTKSDKSSLVSRNVTIGSHRTSIRLEPDMWNGLRDICRREHLSVHDIATAVSHRKPANTSLTAAIRVFVMTYFRMAATEEGHAKAGHGPGGAFMSSLGNKRNVEQDNNTEVFRGYFRGVR